MEVSLHPEALNEARAAFLWYSERSNSAAELFLAEIDHAIDRISKNPFAYSEYQYSTRRFLFRRFPFSLIYFIQETRILVLAVAHGRRKPGYWNNRK
jgi:plasmid stabilization system protein ParE